MEDLEAVIGEGRALELSFDSETHELGAENWTASLYNLEDPEDENGRPTRELIASAVIVRVHRWDDDWLDSLDAASGDLATVGAAFEDMDLIESIDPEAAFVPGLVILDFVSVPEQHRGSKSSHALARGVAYIFRSDLVALIPAELSQDTTGQIIRDAPKEAALRSHWRRGGFLEIPGTSVLMLPLGGRTERQTP